MTQLVLSLFPGIGLLDQAFEEAGFCVVRGPDILWGGDVHRFHPPSGVFAGVKRGKSTSQYVKDKGFLPGDLSIADYAALQGAPEIGERLIEHRSSKPFAVTVLGNGVPLPMGRTIAAAVRKSLS